MKKLLLLSLVCATSAAFAQSGNQTPPQPDKMPIQDLNRNNEPPMLGVHWSQGFEPNARAAQARAALGLGWRELQIHHQIIAKPFQRLAQLIDGARRRQAQPSLGAKHRLAGE